MSALLNRHISKRSGRKVLSDIKEQKNEQIVQAQVKDFFETKRAMKHPPPEEKIDPVKAKCTLAALKKPPKSPPKGKYERIIERSFIEAERSRSTVSDQSLAEQRAGKKIA